MSVGSARTLEEIAQEVADTLPDEAESLPPETALRIILAHGRLGRLLGLPEAPNPSLMEPLAGPTDAGRHGTFLEILFDWVQGRTLREMADQHLAGVSRPGARLEKLVDLIGGHFELFL